MLPELSCLALYKIRGFFEAYYSYISIVQFSISYIYTWLEYPAEHLTVMVPYLFVPLSIQLQFLLTLIFLPHFKTVLFL